ncbi:MAG TPA: SUMF1/EgtB/PvdO family nonheme iron enzyme, partial [Steroidobacteraceae bacterium]|nr:SUMF1/EgtB/PvdO family nonheme iron enzyme [Steroidobacteraceae bacterium]
MKLAHNLMAALAMGVCALAAQAEVVSVPIAGGPFESVLPPAANIKVTMVAPFRLDATVVSNADFAEFLGKHPEWRRDRVAGLFADEGYLRHWASAASPGAAIAQQPATQVSWFAASAYCEARGARLPRWYEWEFAAAASATRPDARKDPAWL